MSACPPANLIEPGELSRYNVPGQFLSQFVPRPLEMKISTAGALGVMQFVWRLVGEDNFCNTPIATSSASPCSVTIDDAANVFAVLSFATGTYVINTIYTVDSAGTVTPGAGAINTVTATRFDLRATACSSVTREALQLMRNAVKAPLLTWTDDAKTHAGAMVYAVLKRGRGMTAAQAGMGDENILAAETMARAYFVGIGEDGIPDGWVDSSPSTDGPLLSAYPFGDDLRGW